MNISPIILLGSQSVSRRLLLEQAHIPHRVVQQSSEELACETDLPFKELVLAIARSKMAHVQMPPDLDRSVGHIVLTADTLCYDQRGRVIGKPRDRQDAREMIIRAAQGPLMTGTAFCVEQRIWSGGAWSASAQYEGYAQGSCLFIVPQEKIEWYLDTTIARNCAGAITIEGIGQQFLASVDGSYTAIIGLPLYEVTQVMLRFTEN